MDYQTILTTATNRRSIRKFKKNAVSREDIEKIIKVGIQAPSGFNAQMWDIVVVDDKDLRDEICQYILNGLGNAKTSKGFKSAPVFLLMYGDERVREYGPAARKDDDKWWEFTLTTSLSCAFMSMQLAATSLGLASMWVSAFRNPKVDKRARKLLNIPSHFRVFEMMAIGYPGMNAGKKRIRRISDVLHYNQDNNYRNQDEVDKWF